jgi:hypothetical protein
MHHFFHASPTTKSHALKPAAETWIGRCGPAPSVYLVFDSSRRSRLERYEYLVQYILRPLRVGHKRLSDAESVSIDETLWERNAKKSK